MKKITLVLLVMMSAFTFSNAQISASCQKTCEVETIVQEGAFLGVRINSLRCTSSYHGVYVREVLENTAAQKFGFQAKDIIISVDNQELFSSKEMVDLIATYEPSDVVTIYFKRNGKEITKDVVLGAKSTKIVKTTVCCDGNDPFFNDFNLTLYPNPAVSKVSISMDEAQAGKYTFQVFNTVGAEVKVEVENFDAGFSKIINIEDLSAGEYFLKITKEGNTMTKTFVIAK